MSTSGLNDYIKFINILALMVIVSCCTPFTLSAPAEEEHKSTKDARNVPPIMKTLLSDIAQELISRSTSNNQVLTLNFTNLLILAVLKGLLWGASYAGTTGFNKGRSENMPEESFITETEILLLLSYLMGDEEKNFDCLQRVACEDPEKTKEYMNAAVIIMNATKFVGMKTSSNAKYEKLLEQLQDAVEVSETQGSCQMKYSCVHDQNENTI